MPTWCQVQGALCSQLVSLNLGGCMAFAHIHHDNLPRVNCSDCSSLKRTIVRSRAMVISLQSRYFSKGDLLMFWRLIPPLNKGSFHPGPAFVPLQRDSAFRAQNNSWFVVKELNGEECFSRKYAFQRLSLLPTKSRRPKKERKMLGGPEQEGELTFDYTVLESHSLFYLLWKCSLDYFCLFWFQ